MGLRFGVSPAKQAELEARMAACGVVEADIEEHFITGGGPGGQKVNRSATCVQLRHRPSGHEVKMQVSRSQGLNRFFARRKLCELLEAEALGDHSPEARKQEKLRKQKARRKRRSRSARDDGKAESDA